MTTFQAIVYGIMHGITEFLPVSSSAHRVLIPYFLGWQEPSGALSGALAAGSLLSLLVYFRHDWASMVSCFLQVILFRKKPMTLDERMPIFLAIATAPTVAAYSYLHERISELPWTPAIIAASLALLSLPLWLTENLSRKNKGMFDWNWLDSAVVGIFQAGALVPGWGRIAATLPGAFLRNYNREAAAKFAFFASMPILAASAWLHLRGTSFHAPMPEADLTWLSFGVALVVSFLSGLLAIGGFMKHIQRKGMGQYVAYRLVLAAIAGVVIWLRR